MSGKSSPEFQWTDDEIQLLLEATQNLKVEEDYKKITRFYPRPTVIYVLVFLPSVVSFCKKLLFLYQTLLNLKKSKSYPIIVSVCFPQVFEADLQLSDASRITFRIGAFQPLSVTKIMPKKICSNGNRRPIQYENWNGVIAIRYEGNTV